MDGQKYELDVTELVKLVKEQDLMLFPALLYLLTQAVNIHSDKICYPAYPVVLDTGSVISASMPYEIDFPSFYLNYLNNWLACNQVAGSSFTKLPEEAAYVHISFFEEGQLPLTDDYDMLILLGKLAEDEKKVMLPLSVCRLSKDFAPVLEQAQKLCHDCRNWLKHP